MKTVIILFCTVLVFDLSGQKPSLEKREILVEKEYSNEIYEVNPIFDFASINTSDARNIDFTKDSLSQILAFTPDIDISIKPIAFKTLSDISGHKGFVKLDKGVTNPLHIQSGYSYSASNYFNLNGSFNYDNRNQREIDQKFIKSWNGKVGMEYYLTNEIKTNLNLQFDQNKYGLYGFPELVNIGDVPDNVGFKRVKANIGFATYKSSPAKWNFEFNGTLSHWSNLNSGDVERNINLNGVASFNINNNWSMSLDPQYYTSLSNTYGNADIIRGSYQIAFNTRDFYADLGAQIDYYNSDLKVWPDVDIRWNVAENTDINLRSSSKVSILSAMNLSAINPYQSLLQLLNIDKDISYQKSLNLEVASMLESDLKLTLQAGYLQAEGDLNFKTNPKLFKRFNYSQVDYELLRLAIGINKTFLDQKVSSGIKIQYNRYARASEVLFNRPTFIINPEIIGHFLKDKMSIKLVAKINSPQSLDVIPAQITESEWRKNISFAFSYRITDQFNVNLNADNILDDEYQVWKGYDNFGRNLSGGLLFKF